jgi:hypothetical protein
LETKKFEAEMELKHDALQQNLEFHRDAIETQRQALQLQLTQHQDTMQIKFLELEQ